MTLARSRRGKQFDPALSAVISDEGEMILSGLDDVGTWDAVIDAEPALAVAVDADQLDEALRAVANFVDLKSPYSLGHAGAVADLAGDAGRRLGMSDDDVDHAAARRPGPRARPAGRVERDLGQARAARAPASGSGCACTRT